VAEHYRIRLAKERFVFSAAHFITYGDNICEPLHGHNYRVAVELAGPLNENQYVVDFILVRDLLQQIVDRLDHRVLLPLEHPTIKVTEHEKEVVATHGEKRWVFPREDCVLLPLANTTAELLARFIALELTDKLEDSASHEMEVAVDECDGQWGVYSTKGKGPFDA